MPTSLLASFENDDADEEHDEEVSSSSTSPNADESNESMKISSPNSSEDTNYCVTLKLLNSSIAVSLMTAMLLVKTIIRLKC